MNLKLDSFKNGTEASDEYIQFKADEDVNLGEYAILDQTFDSSGEVSNVFKHFFPLPKITLQKGEYVKIYSGVGKSRKTTAKGSETAFYVFYWGSDAPVWNNHEKDKVQLIKYKYILGKAI